MTDRDRREQTVIRNEQEESGRGEEETQQKGTGRGVNFTSEGGTKTGSGKKTERPRSNIMTFDQIREREPQGGYISNGGGITLQQVANAPIHRILLSGGGSPTISPSTPFRAFQAEGTFEESSVKSSTFDVSGIENEADRTQVYLDGDNGEVNIHRRQDRQRQREQREF